MTNTTHVETCGKCGEKNATTAKICAMCGSLLPWFQRDTTTSTPSSPQVNPRQSSLSSDLQTFQPSAGQLAPQASSKSGSNQSLDDEKKTLLDVALQVVGGIVLLAGAFFWCGNVFHFYPTFPGVGYITMVIGYVLLRMGS